MGVNKVTLNTPEGERVVIDLTGVSVKPETLSQGETALDASGELITGIKKELVLQEKMVVFEPEPKNTTEFNEPAKQNIVPDSGYDGMSKAYVEVPIAAVSMPHFSINEYGYPQGIIECTNGGYMREGVSYGVSAAYQLPCLNGGNYAPTTQDTVLAAGNYLLGDIVIEGDENLKPENIRKGVNLFGLDGTCVPKSNVGTDVVVATIAAAEYYTVEDALANAVSGETVVLVANSTEDVDLTIPAGVTLNLQSYALTVKSVTGLQDSYLTAAANSGKLYVSKGNLVLSKEAYLSAANSAGNRYILPIWSPTDGCYLFSLFAANTGTDPRGLFINEAHKKLYFQWKHQATGSINQSLISDGASDNELSFILHLEWATSNGTAELEVAFNDAQVGAVTGSYDYSYTLTGYDKIGLDIDSLVAYAKVASNSGATAMGNIWTRENTKALIMDYGFIEVNYPSGAICTCSNGTTTLTAGDTTGTWTFAVPEAGTWTVTATQGSNTKSQSVDITTLGQVETVSLSFALVLFDGGDNTSVTGGWGSNGYLVTNPVSVGSTLAISFGATSSNQNYGTFVFAKNKIDLTNISTLEAVISQYNNKSGKTWSFVISTSNTPATTDYVLGSFGTAKTSISRTGTYSLDVSRYSGQYYVGFFTGLAGQSGLTVRLTATKITGT